VLNKNFSDLVTVIIPYHKKINFIDNCIQSVLNQTFQNFEIILIYDDNDFYELDYIKNLVNKDSRIKLIINKNQLGAGLSRNIGIEQGKGSWIAFIDADDVWKEDKLEIQINFMKKNKLDFSHTSYEIIDKNNKVIGYRKARNFYKSEDLLKSCDIGLSTVILSKRILKGNLKFPELKTKEDFVLWLRLLENNITLASLDKVLTSWSKLGNSLSSSTFQKLIDGFKVYYNYMNFNFFKSCYFVFCLSINFLRK
jgi:teichuronic acid biosynthesis glycosyltransferase TuaG